MAQMVTNLIPGLGRSPGGGNGNPLQYSCLENPMDRGAWWATVHWTAKSRTQHTHRQTHTHTHRHTPIHTHTHTHTHTCWMEILSRKWILGKAKEI